MNKEEILIADSRNIWFEYDSRNDILYINFGTDIEDADEQILLENNIVLRIKNGRVVGITVFDFSQKIGKEI